MFKKTTTQLFFYGLLFISGAAYSAADDPKEYSALKPEFQVSFPAKSSGSSKMKDDAKPEGPKEPLKPERVIPDEIFDQFLWHYKTDLPSDEEAKTIVSRLKKEHPDLKCIIKCIKNPDAFKRVKYPSRLLFVGASGCGKTIAAKAIAKRYGSKCVFVKGSGVGDTYQNSGATFIGYLFDGLLERPEQPVVVIFDELMAIARFVDNDKEIQQNKTAMAFWQALDDCAQKRHICVIGTDNGDPKKLADQLKTRFAHNIFEFNHVAQSDMVVIIKECLERDSIGESHACSDEFLKQLAQSVEHLSIREIEDLIEKSKMLAIGEKKELDPNAKVTERHLLQIFNKYRELTWAEKLWTERNKHFRNLMSARAVSLYMTLGGIGLEASDSPYRNYGFALTALGACMNHYWPRDEKEADDLPLLSTVSHLFAQHQSSRQWETSYSFSVKCNEEAKDARIEDKKRFEDQDVKSDGRYKDEVEMRKKDQKRAKKQIKLSEEAAKRAEEQEKKSDERIKNDTVRSIKEGIKQVEVDKCREGFKPLTALNEHKEFLQEELYKIKPDEKKPEEKKSGYFW